MIAIPLKGDEITTRAMGKVLLHPEVFPWLNGILQSFSGLVRLLDGIRDRRTEAYMVMDEGEILGMVWGENGLPGERIGHLAFRRHTPAQEAVNLVMQATAAKRFLVDIPEHNRAVSLFVRRAGFRLVGPSPGEIVFLCNGSTVPCHRWVKEIE